MYAMLDLREHARRQRKKEETDILAARLPVSKIRKFKAFCKELGIPVSEAIHLMIDEQLALSNTENNEYITQSYEKSYTSDNESKTSYNEGINSVNNLDVKKVHTRKRSNRNRFVADPWKVDGKIPCAICKQWYSFTNFSRHAQTKHGLSTEEILTKGECGEVALEMVRRRKGEE